jgi:hypothetical protein
MFGSSNRTARRFRDLRADDPFYPDWIEYRRRGFLIFWVIVALPAVLVLALLLRPVLGENRAFFVFFILWVLCLVAAANYATFWRCPRCKKPYHIDYGRIANGLSTRCVHCGLPKWSPDGG